MHLTHEFISIAYTCKICKKICIYMQKCKHEIYMHNMPHFADAGQELGENTNHLEKTVMVFEKKIIINVALVWLSLPVQVQSFNLSFCSSGHPLKLLMQVNILLFNFDNAAIIECHLYWWHCCYFIFTADIAEMSSLYLHCTNRRWLKNRAGQKKPSQSHHCCIQIYILKTKSSLSLSWLPVLPGQTS